MISPRATCWPTETANPRLVAVRGREAAAVVDHGQVSVATEPPGVDDASGRGGRDRGPVGGTEVDPLVHSAPAPAERARDRRADWPAQLPRARVLDSRVRLGRLDLGRQLGAHLLQGVDLAGVGPLLGAQRREIGLLPALGVDEGALARHQLVAQDARLVNAEGEDLRLAQHVPARGLRVGQRHRHLVPRRAHGVGDLPVSRGDQLDVVEAVEEGREAARREQDGELIGRVCFVRCDQAVVEPAERDPVLARRNANRSLCTWRSAFSRLSLTSRSFNSCSSGPRREETSPTCCSNPRIRPETSSISWRSAASFSCAAATRSWRAVILESTDCFRSTMSAPAGAATTSRATRPRARRRILLGSAARRATLPVPDLPRGLCGGLGRVRLGHDHGPGRLVRDGLWLGDDHRTGRIGGNGRRLGHRLRDDGLARRWVVSRLTRSSARGVPPSSAFKASAASRRRSPTRLR